MTSAQHREEHDVCALVCACETYREQAEKLSCHLGIPLIALPSPQVEYSQADESTSSNARAHTAECEDLHLLFDEQGLSLSDGTLSIRGDFLHMVPRLRADRLSGELLVRAAKLKGKTAEPLAIDATAGMGEDSLLLAAAGFRVQLFECNPVIAALLKDALQRGAQEPALKQAIMRMELFEEDSIPALRRLPARPEVVLLDPMFPERRKSALVKKKFQLLHQLERPCANEDELLAAALDASPRKVIVKRPPKGPWLAGRKPDYSLSGKAVRYDCILAANEPDIREKVAGQADNDL